ncbi:MAG: chemotaxis protein CheW [Burkholderiaceae bacterium]
MDHSGAFHIDTFLPYMRDVIRCEQSLHELSLMWRMIEASAKMNCPAEAKSILPTMAATRSGFDRLEQELVHSLVREKVANVRDEIGTKAQYVIDIVVRNLYERTADVGFLATDRELCEFVAGITPDEAAIRLRLRAYRSKYTVYDEIILLDTHGNVLVQIDEETPLEGSKDPLIAQTLASNTYVETFRATDLRPSKEQALIYSRRMLHPKTGAVVGLLCLCFHFEEEMRGIFRSHRDEEARSNLLLLDADNRVIASADERWIPVGGQVPVNRDADSRVLVYGGREYLVRTFPAAGYQGYMGPAGWQGQAMIPVDVAFAKSGGQALADMDRSLAEGLLSHASSFCPPLYEVMTAAETIRRVVWNGQVMTAGQGGDLLRLKTILEQISETGTRSNALFSKSIHDLYETVLSSRLNDAEFVTHLLVDLLDRNLYERSDDCRWWALTPELRTALAAAQQDKETAGRTHAILEYINGLYTVYTRIFVYDSDGIIIASTDRMHDGEMVLGTAIDSETLSQVRSLQTEQDYFVSPFAPSPLYGGRPTYIYHAAIRHPEMQHAVVGGIGIVFDAEPEFSAMLKGALGDKKQMKAFFIDRGGRIIASTDSARPVGAMLDLDASMLSLDNGKSASGIVVHDGQYAVMGCSVSNGYREFKTSDGYCEDVLAVVFDSLGAVRQDNASAARSVALIQNDGPMQDGRDFATFFVGASLFALPAEYVSEALPASSISPISMGGRPERCGVLSLNTESTQKRFVWVFDLGHLISGIPSELESGSQVVIVRYGDETIGLLVSELHGVPKFPPQQIMQTPFAGGSGGIRIAQLVKANRGELLIQVLDVDHLFAVLAGQAEKAA